MKAYYSDDFVTLYHGDCREVLHLLEPDFVVTDPPYGTGGWRRGVAGTGRDPSATLVRETWDDGATDWLLPLPTLAFWPAGLALPLLQAAAARGLTKHRALYMHKLDPKPQVGGRMAWSVEPVWCLSPEGFTLQGGTDWCSASTPRLGRDAAATGHPYEKPLEVMRWLLAKLPDGVVLDPFSGSGTTLRAAKDLGIRAIGVESDERWCEVTVERLSQEVLDFGGAA